VTDIGRVDLAEESAQRARLHMLLNNYTLPPAHRQLLQYICGFLNRVTEYHTENKMSADNIAICFGPNVIRDKDESAPV
jgi:hypothetical protein